MMKLIIALTLLVSGAATECRSATGLDDACDLELVPGHKVLTLPGMTKVCGMMLTAHVYSNHYDTIKTEIQAYCKSAGETACCPTATLGMLSAKDCNPEKGKETKSCESGSSAGKPDISGSYRSWSEYSTNVAGGKEFKAFMGCHADCATNIIKGLEGYTAGSGMDAVVATLLKEFKGDMKNNVPSIFPKQTFYGGDMYCGSCHAGEDDEKAQTTLCQCAWNATATDKKPAFCNIKMLVQTKEQKKKPVKALPEGGCPSATTLVTGSTGSATGGNKTSTASAAAGLNMGQAIPATICVASLLVLLAPF